MKRIDNYVVYHLHSDISNASTTLDSVTKYYQYIERAKECGMRALGFSEHGVHYEWWHKKCDIEKAGMLYIHGVEAYVTEDPGDKKRDNYHVVLMARNYDGFHEINRLISGGRIKEDGHYFYQPRITLDELFQTSDNVLVTTACIGGPLSNGTPEVKERMIEFCAANKHRCFLEIQHHNVESQKELNQYLYKLSRRYGVRLIAGTDTHALNERHVKGRSILQASKDIHFDDEDGWDLTFKTYDELVEAYKQQDCLPCEVYMEAINNTNLLLDLVEPFKVDCSTKYPKIYDNPIETFKTKINEAYKKHPYARKRHGTEAIKARVHEEMDAFEKTGAVDFMLLETYMREWERKNDIYCGPGRGSVSGSMIAYLLGITQMDSMKFNLNFFRFINPDRVSNADIDTDYSSKDRDKVKEFLLRDHMDLPQIQTCEIITFNTIAMKGAIRDVCRALYAPSRKVKDEIHAYYEKMSGSGYNGPGGGGLDLPDHLEKASKAYLEVANYICDNVELHEEQMRKEYPEVFEYVDLVNGTIVSVGTHPSGVLVADRDIAEEIGLCTTSKSKYPVSILNMKELDDQMWVKLDILGLDNVGLINDTCRLLNIPPLTPDTVDLEDEAVWKDIRDDTTMIFQWESESAQAYLKKFMSDKTIQIAKSVNKDFSYIKWLSFGNGLIRPGCASFRDNVANGEINITDFKELDQALVNTFGRITMQEDIMRFCKNFCGYSDAESDTVRRGIAKKKGTAGFINEIHDRFLKYSNEKYDVSKDKLEEIFPPIEQGILDASDYAFSWNHSDPYSIVGYTCGYLRYYHPLEFLTAALNIFSDKDEKTRAIVSYANKVGITISPIKFGHSGADYVHSKEENTIYKGLASIKYMNRRVAKDMLDIAKQKPKDFCEMLEAVSKTRTDSRQLDILIKLGFFEQFGDEKYLMEYAGIFNDVYSKKQLSADAVAELNITPDEMTPLCQKVTAKTYSGFDSKTIIRLAVSKLKLPETTIAERLAWENECYGYIQTTLPKLDPAYAFVQDYECKYKNPIVTLYRLSDGMTERVKIKRAAFDANPFEKGAIIKTVEKSDEGRWSKNANGDWVQDNTNKEAILKKWKLVK